MKVLVVDINFLLCANNFLGGQGNLISLLKGNLIASLQNTGTDFRSLGIQKSGNRSSHFFSGLPKHFQSAQMLLMVSMGKVKTSHIHGLCQLQQQLIIIFIGSHGTYNLRSSHFFLLYSLTIFHSFSDSTLSHRQVLQKT